MRRRVASGFIIIILFLFALGERSFNKFEVIKHVSDAWSAGMSTLGQFETYLISEGYDPFIIATILVVLFSGIIIPDVWPFLLRLVFRKSINEFNDKFHRSEFIDARQDFRISIAKSFSKFKKATDLYTAQDEFINLLDIVKFPASFPPPLEISLSSYVKTASWPEGSEVLRKFLSALYDATIEEKDDPLLTPDEYSTLMRARNYASKFWDDSGREICEGRLKGADIKRQIDSNARDIVLLALSELTLARITPWDIGPGKTCLFLLARDKSTLKRQRLK